MYKPTPEQRKAHNRRYYLKHRQPKPTIRSERDTALLRVKELERERDVLKEALVEHNGQLRSAFTAAQRDGIHETKGTTRYNDMADSFHKTLIKYHALTNEGRTALSDGGQK